MTGYFLSQVLSLEVHFNSDQKSVVPAIGHLEFRLHLYAFEQSFLPL
jgi:hypothetical protein